MKSRGKKFIPAAAPSSSQLLHTKTSQTNLSQMSQRQAWCINIPQCFPCLSLSLSLSVVIIELINIDWSSESRHRLSPCARTRVPGEMGRQRLIHPINHRAALSTQGLCCTNPTPAPGRRFDLTFPPANQTQLQKHLIFPKIKVSSSVEHHCSVPGHRGFSKPHIPKNPLDIKVPKSQACRRGSHLPTCHNGPIWGPNSNLGTGIGHAQSNRYKNVTCPGSVAPAAAESSRQSSWPAGNVPVRPIDLPGTPLGF